MSMRIFSPALEKRILMSLCASNKSAQAYLFSKLRKDNFWHPKSSEIYKFILDYTKRNSRFPTFRALLVEPSLSEDARSYISDTKGVPINNLASCKNAIGQVNDYSKLRHLFGLAQHISEELQNDGINASDLLDKVSNRVTEIRTLSVDNQTVWNLKKDSVKVDKMVDEILSGKKLSYIPTGFRDFDRDNVGIPRGGCFVISAPSGHGKSMLALIIGLNMATWGAKVCYVTLEMEPEEFMGRILSNKSGIGLSNILKPISLDSHQKMKIKGALKAYRLELERKGGEFAIYRPEEDFTIEETLIGLQPKGYDTVIIDYMSLLRDMDGEKQWQVMSSGAKFAKRWATRNKNITILVAQLNEDTNSLRYSKGVKDHACLHPDTLIKTNFGYTKFSDLGNHSQPQSPLLIYNCNGYFSQWKSAVPLTSKKCKKITFSCGLHIIASLDHEFTFLPKNSNEWIIKKVNELEVGNILGSPRNTLTKEGMYQNSYLEFISINGMVANLCVNFILAIIDNEIPMLIDDASKASVLAKISDDVFHEVKDALLKRAEKCGDATMLGTFPKYTREILTLRLIEHSVAAVTFEDYIICKYSNLSPFKISSMEDLNCGVCDIQVNDTSEYVAMGITSHNCTVGDTLISTPKGDFTIANANGSLGSWASLSTSPQLNNNLKQSVLLSNTEIKSINGLEYTTHWHYNGKKRVCKVETINGHFVSVTSDHKFLAYNVRYNLLSYVEARDLNSFHLLAMESDVLPHDPLTPLKELEKSGKSNSDVRFEKCLQALNLSWDFFKDLAYLKGTQSVYDITCPITQSYFGNKFVLHNSNMWSFMRDNNSRTENIIAITQQKARNQSDHSFYLTEDFSICSVTDMDEEDISSNNQNNKNQNTNNKTQQKTRSTRKGFLEDI